MSVINSNMQAMTAAHNLNRSHEMLGRSLTRLSSGSKIVNPSDDSAGLAVSEKLDAQSRRVQAAVTNAQNAISYVQTADGFLGGMEKVLSRMSELANLARDVTKNTEDVALYEQEFQALQTQLRDTVGGTTDEIGGTTAVDNPLGAFNDLGLFGGDSGLTVTIGDDVGQSMQVGASNLRDGGMLEMIKQDAAGAFTLAVTDADAGAKISGAIQDIATERATLGASQSRLQLAATTLQVEKENLSSAISRIRDVDVAGESTQYAKFNILVQSGTAMLAQANLAPQSVLKLLQN